MDIYSTAILRHKCVSCLNNTTLKSLGVKTALMLLHFGHCTPVVDYSTQYPISHA